MERRAKRQLIQRNRESRQIRAHLIHWDSSRWNQMTPDYRRIIDECTREYIRHLDSPLVGENNVVFRDPNMLRLVLILRAWQFGQSIGELVRVNPDETVLSKAWFELLLLNLMSRLDVTKDEVRPLNPEARPAELSKLDLEAEFLGELSALAGMTSELTTEQLAILSAILVMGKRENGVSYLMGSS